MVHCGMTRVETQILAALRQLQTAVESSGSAKPKPNLQPLFTMLDELTAQLPRNSNPNLLHYLHKKSYEKARLLLEGRESESVRGACA